MGHRQQMTPRQLLKFDIDSYKRRLEANKGHNHSYMTEKLYKQLEERGYSVWQFEYDSPSESMAIKKRDELRKEGHYARIISTANRLNIREYELYYKPKKQKSK